MEKSCSEITEVEKPEIFLLGPVPNQEVYTIFSRCFDTCLDDPFQSPGVHENEFKKNELC